MWLIGLYIWTACSMFVACVLGMCIKRAEKPLPELDAPEPDDIDWPRWDVKA